MVAPERPCERSLAENTPSDTFLRRDGIKSGGRELSITLYGTLRNLLGPHHHVDGELPAVSPRSFHPSYGESNNGDRAAFVDRWGRGEIKPPDWRDRYCMITFGEVGRVTLLKR